MNSAAALHPRDLARRLAEAEETIQALLSGQIDAVVDSRTNTPVLLSKAQEALRESEERYRRIVETTNEGIWTIDIEAKVTFVNRRLIEMVGYTREELLGKPLFQFLPDAIRARGAIRIERARQGFSEENEAWVVRKDGSKLWALIKTSPIHDTDGRTIGTLAMMTDKTRHREDEEALRKSEEQYRQIVEATTDGIVKLDKVANIVFANGRFAEMLGYEQRELLGVSVFTLQGPVAQALSAETLKRRLAGVQAAVDTTFRHKNGSEISVNIAGNVLVDGEGQHVGNLAVVRDITERKKLQAQLMVSDRMASVGTLAAGVAHEINNPLAAVIANLDFIAESLKSLRDGPGAAGQTKDDAWVLKELKEPLDDASVAAQRVRLIVRDLKIFSRSPADEPKGPVDVMLVIESSLRMAWNEIRHRARLVKEYNSVPLVKANEARLGQVFLNLIVNAAQALQEGHAEQNEIRVSTRREKDRVVIEVSDTGAGIPPEIIGRIFDAFFTTKAVGVGTGLGLAICQRIVTDMDGELTVDSEVGKGTTFCVSLPVAHQKLSEAAAPAVQVAVAAHRARILVVDDEELVARSVKRILSHEHEVVTLLAAREALQCCSRGEKFDLILCDLMMPEMTGMDLHEELSRSAPEQASRMIFMTGGAFTPKAQQFLTTHPRYIEKPLDVGLFRRILNDFLQSHLTVTQFGKGAGDGERAS